MENSDTIWVFGVLFFLFLSVVELACVVDAVIAVLSVASGICLRSDMLMSLILMLFESPD